MFREYTYSTKTELKTLKLEIRVSVYFEFYFAGEHIPAELAETYTGVIQKQNKFKNISDLDDKMTEIIEAFETKFVTETKRKVILYSIGYIDQSKGHEISFRWEPAVVIETTRKGHVEKRYFRERMFIGSYDGPKQMALDSIDFHDAEEMVWTAEREMWFKTMEDSVTALGNRLVKGFGNRPEILARKIDQAGLNYLMIENRPTQTPLSEPDKKD